MKWRDSDRVRPLRSLRTIGVSALLLAILALAALETWIEYTVRRGLPAVAAGVTPVGPRLPAGDESHRTPPGGAGHSRFFHRKRRSANLLLTARYHWPRVWSR